MRKILSVLPLILVIMGSASAQEDVLRPRLERGIGMFVELSAGLNITLLDGNPYVRPLITSYEQETSIYRSAVGLGPYVGLNVGYELSSHLGIMFQAGYDARYASNSATLVDTCFLIDPVSGNRQANSMEARKNYSVGVTYLSLALLPSYRFDNLFFFMGPTVSIPITRRIEETNTIIDDSPCYYLVPGDDTTKSITGALTDAANVSTRISLKFGIGYLFNVAPSLDIVPQLALDVGLTDLLKQDETLRMVNSEQPQGSSVSVPVNRHIQLNTLQALIGIRVYL